MKERNRLAWTYKGRTAYGWIRSAVVTAMNSGLAEICVYVPGYGTAVIFEGHEPVPYIAILDYSGTLATVKTTPKARRDLAKLLAERDALQEMMD